MAGRRTESAEVCDPDLGRREMEDGLLGNHNWAQEDRHFSSRECATRAPEYSLFCRHATDSRVPVVRRKRGLNRCAVSRTCKARLHVFNHSSLWYPAYTYEPSPQPGSFNRYRR